MLYKIIVNCTYIFLYARAYIEASGVRIGLLTTMIYQTITKIARKTFIH